MDTYAKKELDEAIKRGIKLLNFSEKRIDEDMMVALDRVAEVRREKGLVMLAKYEIKHRNSL